jgi:ABC-type transport system involved in multi-copper enzyme maturation permease subunit
VTGTAAASGPRWTPAIRKEVRAIAPAWLAAIVAMLLAPRPSAPDPILALDLTLAAYFLGTAVVGSLAIGHEFLYGTLGSLLAQPRRRRDVLLLKLAILVPLEIALGVLFRTRVAVLHYPLLLLSVDVLPLVAAVVVAPWLTMLCRSALAGAVFTVALLGACWGAGILIAPVLPFVLPEPGFWAIFVGGESLLCAVGAVMTWRTFMRLEAMDGSGGESFGAATRPRSTPVDAGRAAVTSPRLWLLVRKELRLQLPAMAVAALYIVGCLAFAAAEPDADLVSRALYGITPLYMGLNTLLIGAVSSAEERQLGTAEWQVMLPIAASVQWTIKVLVALAVLVGLALVTPAAVLSIVPVTRILVTREVMQGALFFSVPLVLIGIYISSLCRNSLNAFLAAAPTAIVVWICSVYFIRPPGPFGMAFLARFGDGAWRSFFVAVAPHGVSRTAQTVFSHLFPIGAAAVVIAPLVAAMYFAMRNHGSAERGVRRVVRQSVWMITFVSVATTAWDGVAIGSSWDARIARSERTRRAIRHMASHIDGHVGVCSLGRFESACVNPDQLFPMAGNWRLPVVIAALKAVDSGSLRPDNTVNALLDRALMDDSAASDLARAVSGTPVVDAYWLRGLTRSLLVRDGSHLQDITTPFDMVWLLEIAGSPEGRLLSRAPTERLRDLIMQAAPPADNLKASLPAGWIVWDLSSTTGDGTSAGASSNVVALLCAPDGTFIAVAAFISDSHASPAARAAFLASVIRAVADAY